jgi:ATP-dependent Lhr-like helicase
MERLDEYLLQHRRLCNSMPHTWTEFFARFGQLRPVQLLAIPPILNGDSTLVTAPTAGGKTEAIVAPICELLLANRWPGLSVLMITPTRALVNDLFSRLERPLQQLGIGLGRKTADNSDIQKRGLQFLITTPESTESLLTFHREKLQNIRAVVIDEIHILDGTARGDQLKMILKRLSKYLQSTNANAGSFGFQCVAMSATVAEPKRLASEFLGRNATIVSIAGQRQIDSLVIEAKGTDEDRVKTVINEISNFADACKVLIFVNSRRQVDKLPGLFKTGPFKNFAVFGHHGSLSKQVREDTEARFKLEQRAICVATMTLEVGIDIGDIDLVVCMDPPFSLSSFLQRIGRGGRRSKGITRVICAYRDSATKIIFDALIAQATIGIPSGPRIPFRRSVLIQQFLAYLQQVEKKRRTAKQFKSTFCEEQHSQLREEEIDRMLREMVSLKILDEKNGIYQPAANGWKFIESSRIFSNMAPTPIETTIVDADSGRVLARVGSLHIKASGVRIAGKSYKLLTEENSKRLLVRADDSHSLTPFYDRRSIPYAFDVGVAIASLFQVPSTRIVYLCSGDSMVVFTWLGRLLNLAIAKSLQQSIARAEASSFSIRLPKIPHDLVIPAIRGAVNTFVSTNPFSSVKIERIIDLGPNFGMLTPDLKRLSCEDWLDIPFLQNWSKNLQTVVELSTVDELGRQLVPLVKSAL